MKLFSKKRKDKKKLVSTENEKIKKSKEIIKKEKAKIKAEKKKRKQEKREKFYQTKLGKILKKIFFVKDDQEYTPPTIKGQILSMLYFEIMGAIMCLLILFALSDGKNYFKLYKELNKLIDTYDTITTNYYGDIDKKELIDASINSMLESIDDSYTDYNDKENTKSFMENVNGTYEGIGATIILNEEGKIEVAGIFDNSPAAKAGLKEKDIIIKVDDEDYTNKTSDDMANYVKNSNKTKIKLTILRNNEEKTITITRNKIEIPTVSNEIIEQDNKKIGYINISIFSSVTTKQFKENLKELEKKKIDALIIDVRNNNGGYLSTVTDISSLFLKKGKVIYQLSDDDGTTKIKDKTKEKRTYPIAVLVNKTSASASEILASVIKESYGGYVVGTNTYGKGTVQKTKKLEDGSMIKYTIQKWLTPKGNWINEVGVEPTDYIELDTSKEEDNQLSKAISLLTGDLK